MLKTFLQTKQYLYKLIPTLERQKYPAELGLLRMQDLLKRLGNPHHQFPSIHIAGTCGKGSTTYLIAKIMQEAGYKVGLHTSPHLQTMRERIIINEQLIPKKKFVSLINQIDPIIKGMSKKGQYGKPSYFEVLVAAAFLYFKQQKVDLAVIEAGLGGKYDGTNVLKPQVAVVTNVGLDHIKILGKTKQTILKDKMQIIKTNVPIAITGIKQNYLLKIIKEHCQKKKVPLLVQKIDFKATNAIFKENYSRFNYVGKKEKIKNITINLPGVSNKKSFK
jgi:dihydrofolate synthase/folylpolyglutamate synthase